jgi:hypothetical protein
MRKKRAKLIKSRERRMKNKKFQNNVMSKEKYASIKGKFNNKKNKRKGVKK